MEPKKVRIIKEKPVLPTLYSKKKKFKQRI